MDVGCSRDTERTLARFGIEWVLLPKKAELDTASASRFHRDSKLGLMPISWAI